MAQCFNIDWQFARVCSTQLATFNSNFFEQVAKFRFDCNRRFIVGLVITRIKKENGLPIILVLISDLKNFCSLRHAEVALLSVNQGLDLNRLVLINQHLAKFFLF